MSLDQSIRYTSDTNNTLNPHGLYNYLIVPENLAGVGVPTMNAVLGSTYTDTSTGIEYKLDDLNVWQPFLNYTSFAPAIPDPLVLNELDVDVIKGNSTSNIDIKLGTTGVLSVGPNAFPSRVQVLSDGSIVTNSATSNVIVADGSGNQTTYGPIASTCTAAYSVVGNTGLSLVSNSNNVDITSAAALNLTSGPGSQIVMTSGAGAVIVQPSALVVDTIFSPTNLSLAPTTTLTMSGSVSTLNSTAGDINFTSFNDVNITAGNNIVLQGSQMLASGLNAPQFGLASQITTGLKLANNFASLRVANADIVACSPSLVSCAGDVKPSLTNTYDIGSAILDFKDCYLQNAVTVVSDSRLKKDIKDLDESFGLSFVDSVKPVSYKLKEGNDKVQLGFIAQQVDEHLSSEVFDVVKHDEESDKYHLKYDCLIAPLWKAVQELSAKVKALESK